MFASVRGEIECEAAAASRRSHYVAWTARAPVNRLRMLRCRLLALEQSTKRRQIKSAAQILIIEKLHYLLIWCQKRPRDIIKMIKISKLINYLIG